MTTICRNLMLVSLCILMESSLAGAESDQYTRQVAPFTPAKMRMVNPSMAQAVLTVLMVARAANPGMTEQEYWFIEQEIIFLNPEFGDVWTVPVYRPYTGGKKVCSDIRNWHVAVHKGKMYGVLPALLVAIRSHENPSQARDHYAYGVKHLKGTDLWTQAEGGAKIVARISGRQSWSAMRPTRSKLLRLARVYVGQGEASARNWSRNVYTMMQRCLP